MRKELKCIQIDKDVWDFLSIVKAKHTPPLSYTNVIKHYMEICVKAEEKLKEFASTYGAEAVTGSFSGDLDVKSMKLHMARQLIFSAAAYSGLDPARIVIRDGKDEISIEG